MTWLLTGRLLGALVAGRAALSQGRLDAATALMAPAVKELLAVGNINSGFAFRFQIPWTVVASMTGPPTVAVDPSTLGGHPGWDLLGNEVALARAWNAACQGAVTEAAQVAVSAADSAGARGQHAAEVLCLQTATQFGYRCAASRLRCLTATVEGPRVTLAARYATALTPALGQATQKLSLTQREYEILMLVGQGLSSQGVANRLSLSVRIIDGHIYRAMAKSGASNRGELAAMAFPAERL